LLDIIKAMHSDMGINSLMFTITTRAHTLVDADRCTLFMVDREAEELWSMQGEVNIRAPLKKGIAGTVASTGELLNIQDAYKDPRFNQDFDKKSGYRTTTILAMPIFGKPNTTDTDNVVGVLQCINKAQVTD
jgi:signal transduction protein with GAF and PtsI domain